MSDINIDYINEQLDLLDTTKANIKQAIIDKGQEVSDNDAFSTYAEKISNISGGGGEPTKPFGVKPYKSIEILDNQTDLANYYINGISSGDLSEIYGYVIRIVSIDNTIHRPSVDYVRVVSEVPALIDISTNSSNIPACYLFNPSYTAVYINMARSLGVYDMFVASFLERYSITEQQLLALNGWYRWLDLSSITNPVFTDCVCCVAGKPTIQDSLMNNFTLNDLKAFIDLDAMPLNVVLQNEDDFDTALDVVSNIMGGFLSETNDTNAIASEIMAGKTAYTGFGRLTGTMSNNGELNYTPSTSQQTIPAGYTSGGTIGAVTSSIDANIQAGNIKKDVSILGVTGTLEEGVMTQEEYNMCNNLVDNILN